LAYLGRSLDAFRDHHERLPCGLELWLRETRRAPVCEFQIWARVGSADERPGEEGLAHFHEHMLFKGTEARDVGEIAGAIEGAGGRVNAYTSFDTTVYHATVPRDGLGLARDVIVDVVRHSLFDPVEIEREIEVVLEEIRRSEDSPHQVCSHALFSECFRVHPYRAPILGTRGSVATFDRERVGSFFRRWYGCDNLLIVAVGDFDAPELAASLRDAFADAAPAGTQRARAPEPPQTGLRTAILRRPFERACMELAWPATGLAHPDTPLLDLLAFVLGEGDSSRLVRRVKEREGLVDRVEAYCYTPLDPGVFGASVDLDTERAEGALEAIVREVEWLRRESVSGAELEKARANFLAGEHFERESVSGQARKLGSFAALAGDPRREADYLEAVRTATPADLLGAARRHLAPERLTVAAVVPEGGPALDEKALAGAVARALERVHRFAGPPAALPRPGPEIHSYHLPGGAEVHVEPRREVPVVAVRAALLGGLLAEDESCAGLTHFLTAMWLRGTRGRSAAELARSIESIASDLEGYSGRSSFGLALDAPSANLEPALELFAEILLEPSIPEEELERERRETLAALARREDRLSARAFDLFAAALWQHHPYRLPVIGTPSSIGALGREDLLGHHARWVRSPNLVLAVSGDVDPDAVAERLSLRLAGLEGEPFDPPAPPVEAAPREIRRAELRKDRAQSHLVLGFRGLDVRDEDRFALDVVAQILAGQGGRLFLELRDRRSLAYSVNAMNVEGLAPGFFAVYIATAPEKLDEAREGILLELRRLLDGPPPADELERARRYLVGNFEIDRQRAAARAAQIALDARYRLGADASRQYAARVAAVSGEDVLRVGRRVLDLEAYTLAVIRGDATSASPSR
jgi:zinc protease